MVHADGMRKRRPTASHLSGGWAVCRSVSGSLEACRVVARLPERKPIGVSTVAEVHRPAEGPIKAHQQETMAPDSCVIHFASTGKTSPEWQWVPGKELQLGS